VFKIFHNPRCTKSRETLALLKNNTAEENIEVIEYLKSSPSKNELKDILHKLGITAEELIRKKEKDFAEYKNKELSEDDYLELLTRLPKLIERPIVVKGDKAIIGRPPENVLSLI